MHTELRMDGAICPICLNNAMDALLDLNGVHTVQASISAGCLSIDHDFASPDVLVDVVRSTVYAVTMSANEIVMSPIEPVVTTLCCDHSEIRPGPSEHPPHQLDTLTETLTRLAADGYAAAFTATPGGWLVCPACNQRVDPAQMHIVSRSRFEGDTNPDDQDIAIAMICPCSRKGVYSCAYGPLTPPDESAVLKRLARTSQNDATQPARAYTRSIPSPLTADRQGSDHG
jgi:hypothetical protein